MHVKSDHYRKVLRARNRIGQKKIDKKEKRQFLVVCNVMYVYNYVMYMSMYIMVVCFDGSSILLFGFTSLYDTWEKCMKHVAALLYIFLAQIRPKSEVKSWSRHS